jgi:hypothetical protein
LEIVVGRNVKQCNTKNASAQEISTILNGIISSKVIGKMISTQVTTGTCKMSVNWHRKKDHKIIIVGDSHAWGCIARIKDHLPDSCGVNSYIKPGVFVGSW